MVLGAIALAVAVFGIGAAASRTIGWAVACATVAALIEPPVSALARRIPRAAAITAVLLFIGVAAVGAVGGVLADLDQEFDRLTIEAPRAAAELETSDRFGDIATDFRLEQRVNEMLDRLQDPTSGLASEAPNATSTYLVCAILVAFFLSWGPKLGRAALGQVPDEHRQDQVRTVARTAFSRARRYALAAIARAVMAGLTAYLLCVLADIPAAAALAAAVAGFSLVPGFGIVVGALPALLLKAGLDPGSGVALLAAAFVALQIIDEIVLRKVVAPRSLTVGPAAIVIAMVVGFEIYGIGGAFYGTALAVLGVALLDVTDEFRRAPARG